MGDFLPVLALLVGLCVCAEARADDAPSGGAIAAEECEASPLHRRLCDWIVVATRTKVERDGARAELAAVEKERDQLRAENLQLRTSLVEQREWIERSRQVCNRKAGVAAALGGAGGVGLTAGSVWLAGRLR